MDADTEARLEDCTVELVRDLANLAPFGMGNPTPIVLVRDLTVKEVKVLKDAHLKVLLSDGRRFITGLMWRQPSHPALQPGKKVQIACKPDINTFNGSMELQATLQAVEEQ